jgi:hypothetical protein
LMLSGTFLKHSLQLPTSSVHQRVPQFASQSSRLISFTQASSSTPACVTTVLIVNHHHASLTDQIRIYTCILM